MTSQVTVNIEEADLWPMAKKMIKGDSSIRNSILGSAVVSPLFIVVGGWLLGWDRRFIVVAALVSVGLSVVLMRRILKSAILKQWRQQKGVLGEHTFVVEPEGVREVTEYNNSVTSWKAVSGIERDQRAIYVHLGKGVAHMIPIRSFGSDLEADRFESNLREGLAGE